MQFNAQNKAPLTGYVFYLKSYPVSTPISSSQNMLPCTMMVEVIPQTAIATPDSHHPRILHIAVKYGVMVSFREVSILKIV